MDSEVAKKQVQEILDASGDGDARLVPILLAIQAKFGYLPQDAIKQVGEYLKISPGEIYSVASFYAHFKLKPIGKRHITVCRGTACHIRGAPQILEEISKVIGVKEGETSEDMEYTLETVACIGCCALAPALKINEAVHGNVTTRSARTMFTAIKKGEKRG
ncbi:MAG: NADH-quinone oxidoreductase subunit NuoE [Dehalococcoidales bacterium]|nr:NADH-quinone oxidoreductase subunit NuoE [Dehalococcoidales bacterium]